MGKIQSTSGYSDKRYKKPDFVMSQQELVELDRQLETYRYKKFSEYWQMELSLVDTDKWIEDNGGTHNGAVVIKNHIQGVYDSQGKLTTPQDCDPIKFETLQEKLRQWTDWKAKKEYAQKMELKSHTETLVKGINVEFSEKE